MTYLIEKNEYIARYIPCVDNECPSQCFGKFSCDMECKTQSCETQDCGIHR